MSCFCQCMLLRSHERMSHELTPSHTHSNIIAHLWNGDEDDETAMAHMILDPLPPGSFHRRRDDNRSRLLPFSHTSHRLRNLCLPDMWSNLWLYSVRCVAHLRELCDIVAPITAPGQCPSPLCFVREFEFAWRAFPQEAMLNSFAHRSLQQDLVLPAKYGTPAKLAFMEGRSWIAEEEHHDQQRDEIEGLIADGELDGPWDQYFWRQSEMEANRLGDGPDWRGEDEDIPSSAELTNALIQLVKLAVLSGKLWQFQWYSQIIPMPSEICQLVASCGSMQDLVIDFRLPTFRSAEADRRKFRRGH